MLNSFVGLKILFLFSENGYFFNLFVSPETFSPSFCRHDFFQISFFFDLEKIAKKPKRFLKPPKKPQERQKKSVSKSGFRIFFLFPQDQQTFFTISFGESRIKMSLNLTKELMMSELLRNGVDCNKQMNKTQIQKVKGNKNKNENKNFIFLVFF